MNKLITVIGCTGTGKSNFAINLARLFNGEIINADAMQMYKGLPITTNKIDLETTSIKHHLMNLVEIEKEIKIHDFEDLSTKKILVKELMLSNKLPILVGGTNYYIQALLFENILINNEKEGHDHRAGLQNLSTEKLFEKLKDVDPTMANYWHPKDRRKILRSLEVFETTGKKHSDTILGKIDNGEIKKRYETLVIWLYSDLVKLEKIIDNRIDKMINNGIIEELEDFCLKLIKANNTDIFDHENGLRQAIGFRAFKEYLNHFIMHNEKNQELRSKGIELLRIHTKQYSKKQQRWIKNKLLPLCKKNEIKILMLDINDTTSDDLIKNSASIVERFLTNELGNEELSTKNEMFKDLLESDYKCQIKDIINYTCEECSRKIRFGKLVDPVILRGQKELQKHYNSKSHKKCVEYNRKFSLAGLNKICS